MEEGGPIWLSINDAGQGTTMLKCKAGDTHTFCFKPSEGWKIHSVTFKGADVTSWLTKDGQFTTPAIAESTELNVTYEKGSSGVNSIKRDDAVRVNVYQGNITVSGASQGLSIHVYDLNGQSLASAIASEGTTTISIDSSDQVVIVKVGDMTVKVRI